MIKNLPKNTIRYTYLIPHDFISVRLTNYLCSVDSWNVRNLRLNILVCTSWWTTCHEVIFAILLSLACSSLNSLVDRFSNYCNSIMWLHNRALNTLPSVWNHSKINKERLKNKKRNYWTFSRAHIICAIGR